ncbi:hypothetical protein AOXY_G32971 [Acipenser oxyrinchus oxyrinchus]|uniref:Tastin n=1 Tax=Acipenser oxyrinchus oxyrinchus TaxID=40147 RepID=A0AAD8CGI3_ACIOX|nr:hypothetical protein AOXY_G32971 [Acipenser oxyrinchus oxyrinchus]
MSDPSIAENRGPGPCIGRSQINCAIVNALGRPNVEPSIQTTMASSRSLREQNRAPADKRNEGASLAQTRIFGREMGTGGLPRENHGGRSALQGDRPSATGAKENTAPQCPARGSKIPVLVKPHRAKPPVNFTKLHQNWEANFQKGKALKKKPCTQPMPFNLTQKGAKTTVVMETDLRRQAKGALDSNPVLPLSRVQKTPDKDKTVHDLTRNPVQANHEAHETLLATNTAHSEQPVQIIAVSPDEAVATHSNAARRMAVAFHTNPAGMEQNGLSQHNQPQSIPFRLNQLPHVALETTINRNKAALAPHTPTHSRNQPPRATVEPRGGIEPCFPRDHKSSARCSQDVIPGLEEAAECSRGEPSASNAPKPLEHNSPDCTVPDSGDQNRSLKQRPSPTHPAPPSQKPGAAVKDGEASVEDFVPDPAALASILQNLGLKPGGAAPSGSASRAPTLGRGSMYLPQRVTMSVRAKGFDRHMTSGQANQNSHRTSVWTPQRVLDTRPQSTRKLSSMQRPCGFRGTPVQTPSQQRMAWMNAVTNKLRNANGSPCMEHVAMRLFEKPEEEDGQLDTQVNRDRDRDESNTLSSHPQGQEEEGASRPPQERETTAPAFFQSVNRESVIVFSQGRKVCRQVEAQESEQAFQATNGALSPAPIRNTPAGVSQSKLVPCPSTFSETQSAPSTLSSSALRPEQALSCHSALSGRLTTSQKEATGGPVGVRWKMPAAAAPPCGSLMKQRLLVQRMQEILLDEECAFYTSRTHDQHRTAPLCRDLLNPLARTFHLQEALHFVPILQAELPAALSSAS